MIGMGVSVEIASRRSTTTTETYPACNFILGPSPMMGPSTLRLPTNSSRDTPGYTTKAIIFFAIAFSLFFLSPHSQQDCVLPASHPPLLHLVGEHHAALQVFGNVAMYHPGSRV